MSASLPPILDVIALAFQAGDAILRIYGQDFSVDHKDDQSPLTEADLASHRVITEGLRRLTPDIPVMSEESATIPWEERRQWQRFWLVDPLDGTKEFVKRNGEFTVNIALVEAHHPVVGVVHVPVTGVTYFGEPDMGAFRQTGDQRPEPIHVTATLKGTPRVVGSRSHAGEGLKRFLENLGNHAFSPGGKPRIPIAVISDFCIAGNIVRNFTPLYPFKFKTGIF